MGMWLSYGLENLLYTLLVVQLVQLVLVGLFVWKTEFYRLISASTHNLGRAMLYGLPLLVFASLNLLVPQASYSLIDLLRIFATCLMIGLSEEAIYRGLIFGVYRKKSPVQGMVISSVLFGLAHLVNFIGMPADWRVMALTIAYTGAIGFLFVVIYGLTNSFVGIVLLHTLYNYCIMITFPLEETLAPEPYSAQMAITNGVLIGLILLWAFGLLWYHRRKRQDM